MTRPSILRRCLQALAVALAVVIALLTVRLLQRDPPPPARAPQQASLDRGGEVPIVTAADRAASGSPAAAGATEAALDPSHPTTAVLYGSVRRADGTPVEQGWLTLRQNGDTVGRSYIQSRSFGFASVAPGDYQLTAHVEDELPRPQEVHVEAPRTRVDLELDPVWQLTVNAVTADGRPFVDAAAAPDATMLLVAIAIPAPLAGDLPLSNSSFVELGLGTFRGDGTHRQRGIALPRQTIGRITLPPGKPVHIALLLRSVLIAQMPVPANQPETTFILEPEALTGKFGSVRWRCIDGTGQPLPGARSMGRVADEDGRITLVGLVPGPFDVTAEHGSHRTPPIGVDVGPGVDLDLGDIVLRTPVSVTLAGLDGPGRVVWWLLDPLPNGWRRCTGQRFRGALERNDSIVSVYPGRYAFLAHGPNSTSLVEVDLTTAPTASLRFEAQPAAELRLVNTVGRGFAHVVLTAANGAPVHDREWSGTWTTTVRLPPGRYEVAITDPTNHTTRRALQLGLDGAELRVP